MSLAMEDRSPPHPITVDENGHLLAGARRLAAHKLLGLEEIEVKIVRCGR